MNLPGITPRPYTPFSVAEFRGVDLTTQAANVAPYNRKGSSRHGNPQKLGDFVQEMTVTQDRSFTFTIDGPDPRDSAEAKTYSAAIFTAGWEPGLYRIRAYTTKARSIDSVVTDTSILIS